MAFRQTNRPKRQAPAKFDRTPASDDNLGRPAPDVDDHHGLGSSLGERKSHGQEGQRRLTLAVNHLDRRVQQGRGTTKEVGCVGRPAQRLGADGEDGRFMHAREDRVARERGQGAVDSILAQPAILAYAPTKPRDLGPVFQYGDCPAVRLGNQQQGRVGSDIDGGDAAHEGSGVSPQRAQSSRRLTGRKEGFGSGSETLSFWPLWPLCPLWWKSIHHRPSAGGGPNDGLRAPPFQISNSSLVCGFMAKRPPRLEA